MRRAMLIVATVLALAPGLAGAQSPNSCSQSFAGLDQAKTAILPLTGEKIGCKRLHEIRDGLIPSAEDLKTVSDADAKIQRLQDAKGEAKKQLDTEARKLAAAGLKTSAKGAAAAWAIFKAIGSCTKAEIDPITCAKKVKTAVDKTDATATTYFDDYVTNDVLHNSSEKLITILQAKIDLTAAASADARTRVDAFLGACVVEAAQCITPPITITKP